jgi:hypothetical protein
MRKLPIVVVKAGLVLAGAGLVLRYGVACDLPANQAQGVSAKQTTQARTVQTQATQTPKDIDSLLAPIALYPDQLLAQIFLCAGDPDGVRKLSDWLFNNQQLKGSDLQDAAVVAGFEPSFVALALFPQVVHMMAEKIQWTTLVGQVFAADRSAVFASIQKLRAQARDVGTLKSSPQQQVETKTTSTGDQVIVIEPTNPQVVYVPQYNPTVVYTQAPSSTVVVQTESSSTDAVAAGLIGFTAGIAIGAAVNNSYYYGPYGWHGGAYMYNDAWDDYYDAREDAREDWMDHREELAEERGDRARNTQEQRTERQENRTENRPEAQAQREQRRTDAQGQREQRRADPQTGTAGTTTARSSSYESRGHTRANDQAVAERSGTKSDAFSGYSSGRSERAASARGQQSRSSSRSRGGGGRRR